VLELEALECEPLCLVHQLREVRPLLPALVVAKKASGELVNALHALRCELVLRPVGASNLAGFVRRALVFGRVPDERLAACVDAIARERSLTCREVQLIAYGVGGDSRAQVMRQLSIGENTLKTQVRGLLKKCGARSMDGLVNMVLRQSLVFDSQCLARGGAGFEESLQRPAGERLRQA